MQKWSWPPFRRGFGVRCGFVIDVSAIFVLILIECYAAPINLTHFTFPSRKPWYWPCSETAGVFLTLMRNHIDNPFAWCNLVCFRYSGHQKQHGSAVFIRPFYSVRTPTPDMQSMCIHPLPQQLVSSGHKVWVVLYYRSYWLYELPPTKSIRSID